MLYIDITIQCFPFELINKDYWELAEIAYWLKLFPYKYENWITERWAE